MDIDKKIPITSSEMATIWSAYMTDTLSVCILKFFLENTEDGEIRDVVAYALDLSEKHIEKLKEIFHRDEIPLPLGFTKDDVDLTAPRLFTDTFYLNYIYQMSIIGMGAYSMGISVSARKDIRDYFQGSLQSDIELQNMAVNTMLSKGVYIRAPLIEVPKSADFIDKKGFLTGFLGERRTLNSMEIMHLYKNVQTNLIGKYLMLGFSQVAKSKEVVNHFTRGKEIAEKHVELFRTALLESDIATPMVWDYTVMDSITSPFSDKLMMFLVSVLVSQGIGNYGMAISQSPRHDLGVLYTRLTGEVAKYSDDGAKIMIKNHWMERVPQSVEREELIKK